MVRTDSHAHCACCRVWSLLLLSAATGSRASGPCGYTQPPGPVPNTPRKPPARHPAALVGHAPHPFASLAGTASARARAAAGAWPPPPCRSCGCAPGAEEQTGGVPVDASWLYTTGVPNTQSITWNTTNVQAGAGLPPSPFRWTNLGPDGPTGRRTNGLPLTSLSAGSRAVRRWIWPRLQCTQDAPRGIRLLVEQALVCLIKVAYLYANRVKYYRSFSDRV